MVRATRTLALALAVVLLVLLATAPVSAYLYRVPLTISETVGTAYSYLPVKASASNTWMAANGFFKTTALDTRVETLGGLTYPHMVANDRTMSVPTSIPAYGQVNLYFTTGNSDLPAMSIVTGYLGKLTRADAGAAAWELGNNFTIDLKGHINTAAGASKYLVDKPSAFRIDASTASTIRATIFGGTTGTLYSSNSDGYVRLADGVYATAQAGAVADIMNNAATTAFVGQSAAFIVWRSALYFSTASIPVAAIIDSATLSIYGATDSSTADDFDIVVTNGQPTYPHDPLVDTDYDKTHYSGDGGSVNTSTYTLADYNNIALNATGMGWINKGGATKLLLRSSRDIAITTPTGDEYVTFYTSEQAGTAQDPKLVVNYHLEAAVAGISSGEHRVVVSANGANLVNTVYAADGTTVQGTTTTALDGMSVPDNGSAWALMDNSATQFTSYWNYYKHYVPAAALVSRYEPNNMISGTTLPDREAAALDATITWGSNPAGVTAVFGSMTSSGQPGLGAAAPAIPRDVLPETAVGEWFGDGTVSGSALTSPVRPFITMISDNTTLTELQVWRWLGFVLVLFVTLGIAYVVRGHYGIVAIIASAMLIALVAFNHDIFPLWIAVLAVGLFIGGLVAERSPYL